MQRNAREHIMPDPTRLTATVRMGTQGTSKVSKLGVKYTHVHGVTIPYLAYILLVFYIWSIFSNTKQFECRTHLLNAMILFTRTVASAMDTQRRGHKPRREGSEESSGKK